MLHVRTSRVVGNDPESGMSNTESTQALRAEIAERKVAVRTLDRQRVAAQGELRRLEAALAAVEDASPVASSETTGSGTPVPATAAEKIALFRSLFRGRDDVYPKLWVNAKSARTGYAPACANEWVRGVCEKPRVRCGDCSNQAFLTVSDRVIADHLQGRHVIGVYPLLTDETCWFLAADFDKGDWQADASAFREACKLAEVPVSIELNS